MKNSYSYNSSFLPQSSTRPIIWDLGSPPSNGGMNLGLILHGGVVYNDPGNAEPSSAPDPEDPPSEPESEPPSSPSYPPIPDESDDEPSTPAGPSNIELKLATLQRILNNNSGFNTGLPVNEPLNLTFQPVNYNPVGNQTPVAYKQINVSNPQPIGQELAMRVAQCQAQANQIAVQQTHQQVSHVLDQLALSQGLPTYKEFHAQNGIPYPAPLDPRTLGIAKAQAAQQGANPPVQAPPVRLSDYSSLTHAQVAQKLLDYQAQVFENQRQAMLAEQQRQTAHIAWANQKATELRQQYVPKQRIMPKDQLINTRPLDENPALQQMIMHSNEVGIPSIPLTETKTFLDKAQELQHMAKQLKNMKGLDDVDATSALIARAAKLSGNNSEEFIFLMNEVLFGINQNIPGLDNLGIIPARHFKRIHIGDQGMNPLYQDKEDVQMSHFWGYVNYGYFVPKDIVKVANLFHEYFPGPKRFGSQEDYRLGAVGYNIGQALAKSNISPLELSDRLDMILRSDRFNVILDDNPWLKTLPKAQK